MNRFVLLLKFLLLKAIPVKKGRIVCTSLGGHFSDSPKYISAKIKEIRPEAEVIWLVDKNRLAEVDNLYRAVDINSFKGNYYASSAEIRIDNVYGDCAFNVDEDKSALAKLKLRFLFWLKKKNQIVYTTWHGTPIKRMSRDQIGNNWSDFLCNDVRMFLDNQNTVNIMRHLTFNKIDISLLGLPRNDLLFSTEDNKSTLKKKLGLPTNKRIVLFAPTFRNDGKDVADKNIYRSGLDQLEQIDFNKLFCVLNSRFGGEWVFVCRFHYHVEKMVNWNALEKEYSGRIINGNMNDDMAEYLACADVLLTDVSSCSFDFSLTGKPCFLFFPDYERYITKERGLYYSLEELPFPLSKTFDELIGIIGHFNQDEYQKNVTEMLKAFGYVQETDASTKLAKLIIEENGI